MDIDPGRRRDLFPLFRQTGGTLKHAVRVKWTVTSSKRKRYCILLLTILFKLTGMLTRWAQRRFYRQLAVPLIDRSTVVADEVNIHWPGTDKRSDSADAADGTPIATYSTREQERM
jgi:hypothetical protein